MTWIIRTDPGCMMRHPTTKRGITTAALSPRTIFSIKSMDAGSLENGTYMPLVPVLDNGIDDFGNRCRVPIGFLIIEIASLAVLVCPELISLVMRSQKFFLREYLCLCQPHSTRVKFFAALFPPSSATWFLEDRLSVPMFLTMSNTARWSMEK